MTKLALPDGIDPATPAGELTFDQLEAIAAMVIGHKRWANVKPRERKRMGRQMAAKRMTSMTPAQRRAVAKKGGLARQAKRREDEKANPPTPLS